MEEPGASKIVRIKSVNGGRNLERRVSSLEARMKHVETSIASVKQNTDEILALISHGKSVAGFVGKHGPRVVAFLVGVALTKGWIGHDLAQFLNGFFIPGS